MYFKTRMVAYVDFNLSLNVSGIEINDFSPTYSLTCLTNRVLLNCFFCCKVWPTVFAILVAPFIMFNRKQFRCFIMGTKVMQARPLPPNLIAQRWPLAGCQTCEFVTRFLSEKIETCCFKTWHLCLVLTQKVYMEICILTTPRTDWPFGGASCLLTLLRLC